MKKEKTVLIRLSEEQYGKYKNMCKKQGFNMSQRFRNFIDKEINFYETLINASNEKVNN